MDFRRKDQLLLRSFLHLRNLLHNPPHRNNHRNNRHNTLHRNNHRNTPHRITLHRNTHHRNNRLHIRLLSRLHNPHHNNQPDHTLPIRKPLLNLPPPLILTHPHRHNLLGHSTHRRNNIPRSHHSNHRNLLTRHFNRRFRRPNFPRLPNQCHLETHRLS